MLKVVTPQKYKMSVSGYKSLFGSAMFVVAGEKTEID